MAKKRSNRTQNLDYSGYARRFKQRLQGIITDIVAENWPGGDVDLFSQYRNFPYPTYEWAKRIAVELEAVFSPIATQYGYNFSFKDEQKGRKATVRLTYSPKDLK